MVKKLFLISEKSNYDFSKKKLDDEKIISFDYFSHKKFDKLKIKHDQAENFLNYDERLWIFDSVTKFYEWFKDPSLKIFEFKGINILSLLDKIEFHTLLMEKLILLWTVKKIIKKESPEEIVCPYNLKEIIEVVDKNNSIRIDVNSKNNHDELLWDSINVKHSIAGKPISMKISRRKFTKLKNILDKTVSTTFGLWFDFKNSRKKTILLLEMYPPLYEELLQNLKTKDYNVIIVNRRRPVTLDKKSIQIMRDTNCKLISRNELISKEKEKEILGSIKEYSSKIREIWDDDQIFNKIFRIEDISFWNIIKEDLHYVYNKRISEYLELVVFAKELLKKVNVSCIMTLYDSGETEQVFLQCRNKDVNALLLEHGFSLLFPESKRFGALSSYDSFTDKIIVWSDYQKDYLISNYGIESNRIFAIGSPRHDKLTKIKSYKINNDIQTVLVAPTPITQLQGFDITEIHQKFEKLIQRLCKILQSYSNVKIIFKIHPSQSKHNEELIEIIKQNVKNPIIHLLNPVSDLIQSSDLVITITPEGWAPSTIILESMILGKPTMNIILDDNLFDFNYIKENAIIAISDKSDLEKELFRIFNDEKLRNQLSDNSKKFTQKFLGNYGIASKKIAELLKEQ